MKAECINLKGEPVKEVTLPDAVFCVAPNLDLMHQVVRILQLRSRKPIAHVKGRGDVSGGGKKPWRQKGTGRARHGSTRSPIWKGGGVTHGPTNERVYAMDLNAKMKAKALKMALSMRAGEKRVLVIDSEPAFDGGKTKQAALFVAMLQGKLGKGNVLFVHSFGKKDETRALRNLKAIRWNPVSNMTLLDVLAYPSLVLTLDSLKQLTSFLKVESRA